MTKPRTWSRHARQAAILLGSRIKLERKQRQWSEQELAERAGISRTTLKKIEQGELGCAVGLVFEAAVLVGIPLFESEGLSLSGQIQEAQNKTALLPRKVKGAQKEVFDDF